MSSILSDRDTHRLNYLWAAKYVWQFNLDDEELAELAELEEKYRGRS